MCFNKCLQRGNIESILGLNKIKFINMSFMSIFMKVQKNTKKLGQLSNRIMNLLLEVPKYGCF